MSEKYYDLSHERYVELKEILPEAYDEVVEVIHIDEYLENLARSGAYVPSDAVILLNGPTEAWNQDIIKEMMEDHDLSYDEIFTSEKNKMHSYDAETMVFLSLAEYNPD